MDHPDPLGGSIGNPQSFNRYGYVLNDPVNLVDPTGLKDDIPCIDDDGKVIPCVPPSWTVDVPIPGNLERYIESRGAEQGVYYGALPNITMRALVAPQNPPAQQARNCGVNPITGTAGFTQNPVGQDGHLRAPRGGRGEFGAARRNNPGGHRGLDIAGTLNVSPVYANRDGTVSFAGRTAGDGGWMVIVHHAGGTETRYAHLQANSIPAAVTVNAQVTQGQQIGVIGDTGNAGGTPPHVHFGVRQNGRMVDPDHYLNNPC